MRNVDVRYKNKYSFRRYEALISVCSGCAIESKNGWSAVLLSEIGPQEEDEAEQFIDKLILKLKWSGDREVQIQRR